MTQEPENANFETGFKEQVFEKDITSSLCKLQKHENGDGVHMNISCLV